MLRKLARISSIYMIIVSFLFLSRAAFISNLNMTILFEIFLVTGVLMYIVTDKRNSWME